jgi:hypothetical protein
MKGFANRAQYSQLKSKQVGGSGNQIIENTFALFYCVPAFTFKQMQQRISEMPPQLNVLYSSPQF